MDYEGKIENISAIVIKKFYETDVVLFCIQIENLIRSKEKTTFRIVWKN